MKGTLHKTEQGWMVSRCVGDGVAEVWEETLPLHPEFIDVMDTCFTSKFTQEVEFEIVRHCKKHNSDPSKNSVCTLDCGYDEVSYAKLITGLIDTKMVSPTYTGEYPFKKFSLIDETPSAPASDSTVMIKQETLYTEEQVKLAYMQGYNRGKDGNPNHMESYIEFLKQPKKD